MLYTCEQVSNGHPDKLCDQISDAILADCLVHDPMTRAGIECLIKNDQIVIAGEITSKHDPDYELIAKMVLDGVGVDDPYKYKVTTLVTKQSGDIAMGVDKFGAGDQGMMFGYACDETPEMLPLPYVIATDALKILRKKNHPFLKPDAKSQVSFDYDKHRIDTFLISTQHTEEATDKQVREAVWEAMIEAAKKHGMNTDYKVLVNPTGRFVLGGSFADAGLTGRKIIADTYGGVCRHGGGAFSGKDPTKVDRSAAYMARKIAKDIIRAGWAHRCEVQLAYAIGIAEPVSIRVDTFNTGVNDAHLVEEIRKKYDLTPQGIITELDLRNVDYNRVSAYGHFTDQTLPWEV